MKAALGEGNKPMKIGAAAQFTQRLLKRPERPSLAVLMAFFFSIILCINVITYITPIILRTVSDVTVLATVIAPTFAGILYKIQQAIEPMITAVDIDFLFATKPITTANTMTNLIKSIVLTPPEKIFDF